MMVHSVFLTRAANTAISASRQGPLRNALRSASVRKLSFQFAGAKKLNEIMKTELLKGKSTEEITDIWKQYHKDKKDTACLVLAGKEGKMILERAKQCPFFIQPVFRDDGFFTLVSQFQSPSYFLLAYLEDYKTDPSKAHPLVTFSVYDDLAESHDVALVRGEVVNKSITEDEGRKIVSSVVDVYRVDKEFEIVHTFNKSPTDFDIEDYISCQNQKWKQI